MSYAWEKFHGAMYMIANTGTVQKRLADAYSCHLSHLRPDQVPESIREEFGRLRAALTPAQPEQGEEPAAAAAQAMTEAKAYEHLMLIIRMYNKLAADETPL